MFDLLFKNASVIDGSGASAYAADVGVSGGKIEAVSSLLSTTAREVYDCSGKVLCPGLIDTHSHSDLLLLSDPSCSAKLEQGVTTEIAGQCGLTIAPVSPDHYQERNARSMVSSFVKGDRSFYTSTAGWYDHLEKISFGTNQAAFIGQGTVRETVMGYADRPADREELVQMKNLVREAMEEGALGLSSGLAYSPGNFTPHEEIIELCRVVAEYDGIYVSHMRNQANEMLECVEDTIDVARQTGCRACVSHIKCIGRSNWGKMKEAVQLLENARSQGLRVWCDVYPYTAGATTLTVTIPPSLLEGGKEKLTERLQDSAVQQYIREQFAHPTENWENAIGENGFESFMIAVAPKTPEASGKRITEYAQMKGMDPFDAYIRLLADNHASVMTVNFVMSEKDLLTALRYPECLIGSDGTFSKGDPVTHPRSIGTFPRYLGRYVREQKLCSAEEAIAKVTGKAAKTYRLSNKGFVREGMDADLVVLDWDKLIDTADYADCFGRNAGIDAVVVNGYFAVRNGSVTGERRGHLIRMKERVK